MKSERQEELLVRWMDDELNEAEGRELEELLQEQPELRALRDQHALVRRDLREVYTQGDDIPYGDFFQSRLQRAIAEEENTLETPAPKAATGWKEMFRWWLAPVGVGAMALAFLAGTRVASGPEAEMVAAGGDSPLLYTPEGGITAHYQAVDDAGANVIFIEGLAAFPDSLDLMAGSRTEDESDLHLVRHEQKVF
ncbi:MAG: hypothetical protein Q7Q71_10515 [Verrucomicrobiota bacterium JB023]|nr:hypothetical protein [Verrucomicrobiota bacterium JB023]